jgi:hypothetical protein
MKCPVCDEDMKMLATNHFHCSCGVCMSRGVQLIWYSKKPEPPYVPKPHCPKYQDWPRDYLFKTGGLA